MSRYFWLFITLFAVCTLVQIRDIHAARTGCRCEPCCVNLLQNTCAVTNHAGLEGVVGSDSSGNSFGGRRHRGRMLESNNEGMNRGASSSLNAISIDELLTLIGEMKMRRRRRMLQTTSDGGEGPGLIVDGRDLLSIDDAIDYIRNGIDSLQDGFVVVRQKLANFSDTVEDKFEELKERVVNASQEFEDSVEEKVNKVKSTATDFITSAVYAIVGFIGGCFSAAVLYWIIVGHFNRRCTCCYRLCFCCRRNPPIAPSREHVALKAKDDDGI